MRKFINPVLFTGAGAVLVGLAVYSFLPTPVTVDAREVTRGPLQVSVQREGKTRVKERYLVSTPLAGRLQRIELHPGDKVKEGETVLAVIEPVDPSLLDARALTEAETRVKSAEESKKLAQTNLEQARAEYQRARKLAASGNISGEEFERLDHKQRAAAFSSKIADFELELARAAFVRTKPRSPGENGSWRFPIRSPITGCVLEVNLENAKVVTAGTELLKLGALTDLECVIDVLSTDGVKVRQALSTLPEVKVELLHWGGERPLRGRVRLVEPAGFTKVSALGVEEQRVNVLVDFVEPIERWGALGDSYRVEARIIVWEKEDVLRVPSGALFREGQQWAVFRIVNGRAVTRIVKIGQNNGQESEVIEGLSGGDRVIAYPSDRVRDGARVVTDDRRP